MKLPVYILGFSAARIDQQCYHRTSIADYEVLQSRPLSPRIAHPLEWAGISVREEDTQLQIH